MASTRNPGSPNQAGNPESPSRPASSANPDPELRSMPQSHSHPPTPPIPDTAKGTPVGDLLRYSRLLYERGLICATGGNTSVRVGNTVWVTRTGAVLGELEPEDLVPVALDGTVRGTGQPSKELGMHLALYTARPEVNAVVHAHPLHCIAYSALHEPEEGAMVSYTAAFYMRAGRVPMVPYFPSGSHELHAAVAALAPRHHAILLRNHGVVAGAPDPCTALGIVEEMEQNAQLALILERKGSGLTPEQCAAIDRSLGRVWE